MVTTVTLNSSNSTSVSLEITLILLDEVFSFSKAVSSTATGASFTEDTVIIKVPVESTVPSEIV